MRAVNSPYFLFDGYAHLASGLSCGLAGLAAGMAIGIVGDAGVRCVLRRRPVARGQVTPLADWATEQLSMGLCERMQPSPSLSFSFALALLCRNDGARLEAECCVVVQSVPLLLTVPIVCAGQMRSSPSCSWA